MVGSTSSPPVVIDCDDLEVRVFERVFEPDIASSSHETLPFAKYAFGALVLDCFSYLHVEYAVIHMKKLLPVCDSIFTIHTQREMHHFSHRIAVVPFNCCPKP